MKDKNEIRVSKKIRDIDVDLYQHFFVLNTMLVVFNIFLTVALIYMCVKMQYWYIYVIGGVLFVLITVYSILTHKKAVFKYSLHENSIVILTIFRKEIINLADIASVSAKKTFIDKMFKRGSCTIVLRTNSYINKKYCLYYLNEDGEELCEQIKGLIEKTKFDIKTANEVKPIEEKVVEIQNRKTIK